MFRPSRLALLAGALVACSDPMPPAQIPARWWGDDAPPHTATMVRLPAQHEALLVHPDGDSVAFVDLDARALVAEVPLGPTPTRRPDGRWEPPIAPVAVALAPHRGRAFVVGRNDGSLHAIDLATRRVVARATVCTEPVDALVGPGEDSVLVACAADRELADVDPVTLAVRRRITLDHEPGAMALDDDAEGLFVTHPMTGAVLRLDAVSLAVRDRGAVPEVPWTLHPIRAHGVPRAFTDLAVRPTTRELWTLHQLYSTTNSQPVLNFESTVFPAVTLLDATAPSRTPLRPTLSTDSRLAGIDGALLHIVSNPRALAFTPDGRFAVLANRNSESVTVLDATRGEEVGFVQDLAGRMVDAVVMAPDGAHFWLNARSSGTVLPFALSPSGVPTPDGAPFASRVRDPMPETLRTGQWMFHNANDRYQAFPITVNHWLSCESCHPNGGTAAITQRFEVGPRDTPDLRAGLDGFLMHTATRTGVGDFWRTIDVEQGGLFRPDDFEQGPLLEALTEYVVHAIAPLHPPRTDAAKVARGDVLFHRDDVGCARCHTGPRGTDSGANNPGLSLAGEVRLYDVGTCALDAPWTDRPHRDVSQRPRDACRFDTPTLHAVARTGPWLHDGSAATLLDVLTSRNAGGLHGHTAGLSRDDLDDLVEYLRAQ